MIAESFTQPLRDWIQLIANKKSALVVMSDYAAFRR